MEEDEPIELSSPACAMHAAADAYMGYAAPAEIIAVLNELLAGARANARVAMKSRHAPRDLAIRRFLRQLALDETKCCSTLTKQIERLGGRATAEVAPMHETAMTIPDLGLRLIFLNRGQGWIARRLKAVLPRIREDNLYQELRAMLQTQERNCAEADALVKTPPPSA